MTTTVTRSPRRALRALALTAILAYAVGCAAPGSAHAGSKKTPKTTRSKRTMSLQTLLTKAKDELVRRGLIAAKGVRVSFEDELLLDARGEEVDEDEGTPVFVFAYAIVEGDNARKGKEPVRPAALVDASSGRVYYRDPKGLTAFFRAVGYPDHPDRLEPEQVLTAWYLAVEGHVPKVARNAKTASKRLKLMVGAPVTRPGEGGAQTTIGWTSTKRGTGLKRHTIMVAADGVVHATTEPAEDLVPPEE